DWFEALVLGIVQGLTEFLPISSTGHLYIGRHLFGLDEAGLFLDTMLHLGTLIALVAIYHEQLIAIVKNPFSKLSMLLVVGTIPAVVVGLALKDFFEEVSRTGVTIGWEFLVTGAVLWWADRGACGTRTFDGLGYRDALIIGCAQAFAILPAISRSGMTIAAGIWRGLSRAEAASFSFLVGIPAMVGALILQLGDVATGVQPEMISTQALIVATIGSGVAGFLAIQWMIRYLKNRSLKGFAVYVSVMGALILVLQWTNIF
ncbi:MAG: undecaprenyl-diphosphate phosphatase, partial [Bacilli bacterium]